MNKIIISSPLVLALTACVYVPIYDKETDSTSCKTVTRNMSLDMTNYLNGGNRTSSSDMGNIKNCQGGPYCAAFIAGVVTSIAVVSAGSYVISGSIVVSNNTIHWLEYQGMCSDGSLNQAKQKLFGTLPDNTHQTIETPNVDLQLGVATHDFSLIARSLNNGADVNNRDPSSTSVFCHLTKGREKAVSENRVEEFDKETDRVVDLLLSHGASPAIVPSASKTFADCTNSLSTNSIRKLLMRGWPDEYSYWLYAGVTLRNSEIIKEAIAHGANPNGMIKDHRYLELSLMSFRDYSDMGLDSAPSGGLDAMEELLKSGAKVEEYDIFRTYVYSGDHQNAQSVFELLINHASPATKKASLARLSKIQDSIIQNHLSININRQANLGWLIKRLEQSSRPTTIPLPLKSPQPPSPPETSTSATSH